MKKLIVLILMVVFIPFANASVYNFTEKATVFSTHIEDVPLIMDAILKAWHDTNHIIPVWVVVVPPDDTEFGYFHPLPDSALGFVFVSPKGKLSDKEYVDKVADVIIEAIYFYRYFKYNS